MRMERKVEAPSGQLVEGHRRRQGLRGRLVLQVPLGHQVHPRRVLPRHKLRDDLQAGMHIARGE